MLHTRICDLLEIEHPIINAPMAGVASGALAAAVSEAGGFGLIGCSGRHTSPEWLRDQIRIARERTSRPFGVGFITSTSGLEEQIQVALEERVSAVSHSFADPTPYVEAAHDAGIKVLAQVQKVSHARKVARAGIDAVAAQGTEAGGHTGYHSTLPMVLAVMEAVGDIPVIAAGGIADGRGLAAILMLGAEGAWIGTRFVASHEASREDWEKERLVLSDIDDTILVKIYDLLRGSEFPADIGHRVLRNKFLEEWHGRENEALARVPELRAEIEAATRANDASIASVNAGDGVGLITSVEPAGVILRRIVAEAEEILRNRPKSLLGD
jgi:nitronate monooxygenase